MAENASTASVRLCSLVGPHAITLVDVGASGGIAKRWRPLARSLRIIAFELDARSDPGAAAASAAMITSVRRAVSNRQGPRTFYLTRKPQTSSLLMPNMDVRRRFPNPARADILSEVTVECTTVDATLDELAVGVPDFIKIDTQGSELDVLRGAERSLRGCFGLEVEVEFQPLYHRASLFRDIDSFVSRCGFELFDLRRTFFARSASSPVEQPKGQIVFGDALHFRDWREVADDREHLLRAIGLLLVYGYADVVMEALDAASLTVADRRELTEICAGLSPAGVPGVRKDAITGAGFQLP